VEKGRGLVPISAELVDLGMLFFEPSEEIKDRFEILISKHFQNQNNTVASGFASYYGR